MLDKTSSAKSCPHATKWTFSHLVEKNVIGMVPPLFKPKASFPGELISYLTLVVRVSHVGTSNSASALSRSILIYD
jgi:hypothetical protein